MEREYLEYVGFFSLSITAAAAAYFIDLGRPLTFSILLLIPVSFGFSAFVSKDSFRRASLASLMTLFLLGTRPVVSAVAVIVAFGNPLISLFAGGNTFRDFFNSVTLPMLIAGLLVGGAAYGEMQIDSESRESFRNFVSNTTAEQAEITLNQMDVVNEFRSSQTEALRKTSEASVERTSQIISKNLSSTLNRSQRSTLRGSISFAREEVPKSIAETASASEETHEELPISDSVSNLVDQRLRGEMLLLVIPLSGLALYSLNPFIGLLTGVFGVLFRYMFSEF